MQTAEIQDHNSVREQLGSHYHQHKRLSFISYQSSHHENNIDDSGIEPWGLTFYKS